MRMSWSLSFARVRLTVNQDPVPCQYFMERECYTHCLRRLTRTYLVLALVWWASGSFYFPPFPPKETSANEGRALFFLSYQLVLGNRQHWLRPISVRQSPGPGLGLGLGLGLTPMMAKLSPCEVQYHRDRSTVQFLWGERGVCIERFTSRSDWA